MWLLKHKNCAEHPVSHGQVYQHAHGPGQTPAGLRQSTSIGDGVGKSGTSKNAKMKQSTWKFRSSQCVEQTDHHKGNDVLQVILVAPVEQKEYLTTNYEKCTNNTFKYLNITISL